MARRRSGKKRPGRRLAFLLAAAALVAVAGWAVYEALQPGPWQRVFATREGLTGQRTASGRIIEADARFVALPHPRALHRSVEIRYRGRVVVVPVMDVGPWNTHDAYWESGSRPASEAGRGTFRKPTNRSGIDLSDATFADLGMRDNDVVEWRFVHRGYIPLPRL